MATRTVRKIIDQALSLVNVFSIGQTSQNEDTALALAVLQDLIAELNQDNFLIPFITEDTHTLVADQASYTIGTSGSPDISTTRPDSIKDAFARSGDTDYSLEIISGDEYRNISLKSTSTIPEYLYYDPGIPNGTIYLYPTPNATDVLHIISSKTFTEPSNLTEDITSDLAIPRDYALYLQFALADLLQIHFSVDKPIISQRAAYYKMKIKNRNFGRQIGGVGIEPQSAYSSSGIWNKIPR